MAKLTDDIKLKILADWKVGISQNQLAKKYLMSPATINKLCKGIEQSNIELVNAKVSVITALNEKNEYEVNSIEAEVNNKIRRANLVFGGMEKLAKLTNTMIENNQTVEKINCGDGMQNFEPRELNTADLKNIASTLTDVGKALGVIESGSAINIQNTNAQQNNNEAPTIVFQRIGNVGNN